MDIVNNKLQLGGVFAEDLAKKYGSPLYVYEEEIIRQRYQQLVKNIPYSKLRIHYACKANTNLSIMRILREEGAYIDAVSPGEVFLAIKSGFLPEQILFTGNNATDEDMRYCIEKNVMVNLGSLSQLEKYGKLNPNSKISVRINPDVGAGYHDHCITGGPDSKFGIYFDKVEEIKKLAEKYNLTIAGIHEHIGSGILETGKFLEAMEVLLKVARSFDNLEFVDFGGGLGVPYRPEERPLDIEEFGSKVSELFENFCRDYGNELTLAIEPGRYLVAESGYLLTVVNNIKETPKHRFVGTDTGFNQLIRPAMYGSYHHIINASNVEDEKESVVVAGNICESGDVFTQDEGGVADRKISKVREGDVLAICNAGAYGFSMSSNYNSRPKPAEILVKKGKPNIIRKRETFEDFVRGQ
jgi:diaminopimelate decarboxylase